MPFRVLVPCAAVALALSGAAAQADPGYYVVSAYDNAGQRTVDFRYWTVKTPGSPATLWPEVGIGYGVNSRWYTELFASYIGDWDAGMQLSSWNWQNEVLLTQGQWPVDVALHASLIQLHGYEHGWAIEYGPVLQTDLWRTQVNFNAFFEREFIDGEPAEPTELKYQWQVKQRWKPWLAFGLQGFGELGPWNRWAPRSEQSHRAGPALFGSLPIGRQTLIYQAAILKGRVYGGNATMFSMRVQLAF
jgi:hypothetical protein